MKLDAMLKLKGAWETFSKNHPRFPDFIDYVKQKGVPVDSEIKIEIVYPDGNTAKTSVKIKESDLELLEVLKGLK